MMKASEQIKPQLDDGALEPAPSLTPGAADRPPQSPAKRRGHDPDYVTTLCRRETLNALRRLQKSTPKPRVDLRFLSEACLQIAFELVDKQAICERATRLAGRCK